MTGNNPNLDLVNMNAYIKLDEMLSVCSQDIKLIRNSDINQGLLLSFKCSRNDV